jgi:hypothetical protein
MLSNLTGCASRRARVRSADARLASETTHSRALRSTCRPMRSSSWRQFIPIWS